MAGDHVWPHPAVDVMVKYARAVDTRNMAEYASCFTADLEVRGYSGGAISGRDTYVAWVAQALERFGRTQHLLGNSVVTLSDDAKVAEMTTYVQALHVMAADPAEHLLFWGVYHDKLRQDGGEWRIYEHVLDSVSSSVVRNAASQATK